MRWGRRYYCPWVQMPSQGTEWFKADVSLMSGTDSPGGKRGKKVTETSALPHSSSGLLVTMHVNGFPTHLSCFDQGHPLLQVSPTAACPSATSMLFCTWSEHSACSLPNSSHSFTLLLPRQATAFCDDLFG